ncbi:diacylglycerol kinase [Kaistia sp. 32K]|uniref:diacylglycerol/lipid kinase family protein n=1 Tax=Kaistia sp. 32K TaxID=2795690 RepID=UPI0019163DA9|nr:diacylglycerol kinase family protein [Kaistia sp. 32K]BCP54558.1 diacylglycerol kinase [Kaistia sp. 32K]
MADTIVILNEHAGTIQDRDPAEIRAIVEGAFSERGRSAEVILAEGNAFLQAIDEAARSGPPTVVVGGGDGSVGHAIRKLVAANGAGAERTLGVLPLGTMNLFAKTLGMPADLEGSLAALAAAAPRRIDLASVNGRVFHTLAGLGYFAEVARGRAQFRGAGLPFGRFIAVARSSLRAFSRAGVLQLTLETAGESREIEVYALLASNNRLSLTGFDRPQLDEGLIEIHFAAGAELASRMQAGLDLLAGRWRDNPEIESLAVRRAVITSHRPRLWLSVDGELTRMATPLVLESLPAALSVLAPGEERAPAVAPGSPSSRPPGRDPFS